MADIAKFIPQQSERFAVHPSEALDIALEHHAKETFARDARVMLFWRTEVLCHRSPAPARDLHRTERYQNTVALAPLSIG